MKVIGFDWDGTLVDSMSTKSEKFAESTIKFFPLLQDKKKEIEEIYINTRGNTRNSQLQQVLDNFRLSEKPFTKFNEWSNCFSSLFMNIDFPLFPDAAETLRVLKQREYDLFLSTSVPDKDIAIIIEKYGLKQFFTYVLGTSSDGTFRKGKPHLGHVAEKLKINFSDIAFVGDGIDDVSFAKEAGCMSIAKVDKRFKGSLELFKTVSPDKIIFDFEELLEIFP